MMYLNDGFEIDQYRTAVMYLEHLIIIRFGFREYYVLYSEGCIDFVTMFWFCFSGIFSPVSRIASRFLSYTNPLHSKQCFFQIIITGRGWGAIILHQEKSIFCNIYTFFSKLRERNIASVGG